MKKFLAVALSVTCLLTLCMGCGSKNDQGATPSGAIPAGAASEVEGLSEAGVFKVGFDQDFPPMGFVDENGDYTGFDLDLATEVAKRLGVEVKYCPIAWDAKDMELNSGTIDCIWNGFTINGREDQYTWTDPYMVNNQVYVVKIDSEIASAADLAGKHVVVQADSSAEKAINDQPDLVASFGKYTTAPDYNTALMDLETGAIDAVAMDDIVASYQISKRDGKYKVLGEVIAEEGYGVGFKKGNESLRNTVQSTLEEMAADGTLAKISGEWFGKDITTISK